MPRNEMIIPKSVALKSGTGILARADFAKSTILVPLMAQVLCNVQIQRLLLLCSIYLLCHVVLHWIKGILIITFFFPFFVTRRAPF